MKKSKYSSLLRENRELRDTVARLEEQAREKANSVPYATYSLLFKLQMLENELKTVKQQNERFKSCTIKGLSRGPLARDCYVINGAKTYVKKYSVKRMRAQGKKLTQQLLEEYYKTIEEDWEDYCRVMGEIFDYEDEDEAEAEAQRQYWDAIFEEDRLEQERLDSERLLEYLDRHIPPYDDGPFYEGY